MDVFFCDLCGARVNDTDLRAGQGQRSRWDVICANCLEQGLGKEWLGKRSSGRKAAVGAADPSDRVATIDAEPPAAVAAAAEPEPEPVVAPESKAKREHQNQPPADLVAALPPAPFGFDDPDTDNNDEDAAASDDHVATTDGAEPLHATAKVEGPVHDHGSSMSAAASAFSALGAGPVITPAEGEDDDLVDRAYATPAEQLTPAGVAALGESPFGAQARLDNPEKDETALVPTLPGTEEADIDLSEAKKPGSSTSSRRKSARSGTSSRIAKSPAKAGSKTKSSRKSTARGKDHSSTILMVGIGLLVVIGALFGVVMVSKNSGGSSAAANPEVATEQIRSAIKGAEQQALTALRGNDLNAMIAAKNAMQAAQQKIYAFEDEMKKQGNPQDRIDGYLDSLRASDAMMLLRNLNDEIIKRQNQNR